MRDDFARLASPRRLCTPRRPPTTPRRYNQIDALLKATVDPRGDVDGPDGYSPYPGSINQLIFALAPYAEQLDASGGVMPEFVNPKYKDATKTTFKSPARLECMMQDYPKSLPTGEHVGFSVITATTSFSPVKTNLSDARAKSRGGMPTYSAPSGEADVYASNCELLAAAGVSLPAAAPAERGGIRLADSPRVVVDPSFGVGVAAWRAKFPTPRWVSIAAGSTLVLRGRLEGLSIEKLDLAGALVIEVCEGATVTVKSLVERNAGWAFVELVDGEDAPEELAIRGYRLEKRAERTLAFTEPGDYVVDDDGDDGITPGSLCALV